MRDHYFPHAFLHKRSAKKDEQLYRIHIGPRFADTPLSQITRRDVQVFHNGLLTKGQSPASADHSLKLLKRCLSLCCQWEFLDRHVLKGAALFNVPNGVENYLQEPEIQRLVDVLSTDSNKTVAAILMYLICSGQRKMSVVLARWSDIDMENRVWKIPAANSKSKRAVMLPISDGAAWVLEQQLQRQRDSNKCSEWVFPNSETGKPYTTISRVWYRLRKKAGLNDKVRIHDLRHSFASALSKANIPAAEISLLLSHADGRSVGRYLHASMPQLHQSVNRVSMISRPVTAKTEIDEANAASVIVPKQVHPSTDAANMESVEVAMPSAA